MKKMRGTGIWLSPEAEYGIARLPSREAGTGCRTVEPRIPDGTNTVESITSANDLPAASASTCPASATPAFEYDVAVPGRIHGSVIARST